MPALFDSRDRQLVIGAVVVMFVLLGLTYVLRPLPAKQAIGTPSSYSTDWLGTKAAFLLLQQSGYRVERWESPPEELPEDAAGTTLIFAEPSERGSGAERAAVSRFVSTGGRLLGVGKFRACSGRNIFRACGGRSFFIWRTLPCGGRVCTSLWFVRHFFLFFPAARDLFECLRANRGFRHWSSSILWEAYIKLRVPLQPRWRSCISDCGCRLHAGSASLRMQSCRFCARRRPTVWDGRRTHSSILSRRLSAPCATSIRMMQWPWTWCANFTDIWNVWILSGNPQKRDLHGNDCSGPGDACPQGIFEDHSGADRRRGPIAACGARAGSCAHRRRAGTRENARGQVVGAHFPPAVSARAVHS